MILNLSKLKLKQNKQKLKMQTIKHEVVRMVNKLPDEVGYDEIMAEIYFRQKVDKSLKQIEEGKVISHEEAKKRISKWIK